MPSKDPKQPFTNEDLKVAGDRLAKADFPVSSFAKEVLDSGNSIAYAVYRYTASECIRALENVDDKRRLVKASRRAGDILDRLLKFFGDRLQLPSGKSVRVACKAGCTYCCEIRVNALGPEVASIVEYIDKHFTEEERNRTLARVNQFLSDCSDWTPKLRFIKPHLCPLNENGLCTVYDVRPALCRGYHSYSLAQCKYAFENWQDDHPVTHNAIKMVCREAVVEALKDATAFYGYDDRAIELPEALKISLEDAQFEEHVLTSQDYFDGAHKPEIDVASKDFGLIAPQPITGPAREYNLVPPQK